ncbi:glycosyltransferase family 2 protein [Pseudomonas sp. 2FG]|uniref:glycosyltransferase family 2 protein n=1 Tax=Pseudomonas sp. 2FG TaxID=2502191 RepID=UPI0010F8DAF2|nr:glycosyltransferase family 2 protein [Pseudomonas sp. 2FG]
MELLETKNRVSVVIVNHNAGSYLSRCLVSCSAQVAEIILVDNASSDDSLGQAEKTVPAGTRLKVIRNTSNLGFARACNQGATMAEGDFLLFLNPDSELAPDAVNSLTRAANSHTSVGMVGGLLLNADGSEQAGGRRSVPTPWRTFVRAFGLASLAQRYPRLFSDYLLHLSPLPEAAVEVEAISGACMLVPRHALERVGAMDEGYFMHCEDLDWCMRFRAAGLRILFEPGARITHHKGRCSVARPFFVEWHKHLGMVRFYRKFFRNQYPGALMGMVVSGVWLRFSAVVCYHLLKRSWQRGNKDA